MVLRMKDFGGSLKNPTFKRGFIKNQYRGWRLPKQWGAWTVCCFKVGLGKKEGVVFLIRGGVETPMHTMLCVVFQIN